MDYLVEIKENNYIVNVNEECVPVSTTLVEKIYENTSIEKEDIANVIAIIKNMCNDYNSVEDLRGQDKIKMLSPIVVEKLLINLFRCNIAPETVINVLNSLSTEDIFSDIYIESGTTKDEVEAKVAYLTNLVKDFIGFEEELSEEEIDDPLVREYNRGGYTRTLGKVYIDGKCYIN